MKKLRQMWQKLKDAWAILTAPPRVVAAGKGIIDIGNAFERGQRVHPDVMAAMSPAATSSWRLRRQTRREKNPNPKVVVDTFSPVTESERIARVMRLPLYWKVKFFSQTYTKSVFEDIIKKDTTGWDCYFFLRYASDALTQVEKKALKASIAGHSVGDVSCDVWQWLCEREGIPTTCQTCKHRFEHQTSLALLHICNYANRNKKVTPEHSCRAHAYSPYSEALRLVD